MKGSPELRASYALRIFKVANSEVTVLFGRPITYLTQMFLIRKLLPSQHSVFNVIPRSPRWGFW